VVATPDNGGGLSPCNPRVARAIDAIQSLPSDAADATFSALRDYLHFPHAGHGPDPCPVHGKDPSQCPYGTKPMRGVPAWQVILATVAIVAMSATAYVLLP